MSEARNFAPALVNVGYGKQKLLLDVRNNDRCIIDDEKLASELWSRIKEYVPAEWQNCKVLGLNERLRFLRYDVGQKFEPHLDGRRLHCTCV